MIFHAIQKLKASPHSLLAPAKPLRFLAESRLCKSESKMLGQWGDFLINKISWTQD